MPAYCFLSVESRDIAIRVGINGVPIMSDPVGFGFSSTEPINEWLRRTENRLSVWIAAASHEPRVHLGSISASVFLQDPIGDPSNPKQILCEFQWPGAGQETAIGEEGRIELPFDGEPSKAPEMRLWSDAQELSTVSTADRDDIVALIDDLRSAILNHRTDSLLELFSYRYRDYASAYGMDLERFLQSAEDLWSMPFNSPDPLDVPGLPPDAVRLEIVGDGQLILVSRVDGNDAVVASSSDDNAKYSIPVFVAKLFDRWTIVR